MSVDSRLMVRTSEIPLDGLEFHETFDPALLDLATESVQYTAPLQVDCTVHKALGVVEVDAAIGTAIARTCHRCLAVLDEELSRRFAWHFKVEDHPRIDVLEEIRQEILLGYPMVWLCRDDCRGLCPRCGANWNEETCDHLPSVERGAWSTEQIE